MIHVIKISLFLALCVFTLPCFSQAPAAPFEIEVSGQGNETILFIPGLGSSAEVWNETKLNFEKKYTCYTLTMAGFAGVPAQGTATFEHWKEAIASYIQTNNIEQPIIIGHSLGGTLAMALASDYPELISKIVVVDALPCLPALMNPAFVVQEQPDCEPLITQMTTPSDEQFYHMQMAMIPQLVATPSRQKQVVDWTLASDRTTFAEMYCDLSNTDLREKIANVTCPALVLLNAGFPQYDAAIQAQFKNMKTAELKYATKGLHFIMYDDTEWYDQQLAGFLVPSPSN